MHPVRRREWRWCRLGPEPFAVASMDKLKRPGVIGGKIRTVTNAQDGRVVQFFLEQSHYAELTVFVEHGCCFVEKDPARFVQEEPRKSEALLLLTTRAEAPRSDQAGPRGARGSNRRPRPPAQKSRKQ